MRSLGRAIQRRFLKDERGQTAVVLLVMFTSIFGITGMSIETGHVYYAYRLLQASTNAAALAAAYEMPNIGPSSSPAATAALAMMPMMPHISRASAAAPGSRRRGPACRSCRPRTWV